MRNSSTTSKKLVAGTGLLMTFAVGFAITHLRPQEVPSRALAEESVATGSGVAVSRDSNQKDTTPLPTTADSNLLEELLYAPTPSPAPESSSAPSADGQDYSEGLAEILYGMDTSRENVLSFGEAQGQLPVGPYPLPLSRTFYYPGDLIRIFSGVPRSVVEIYRMDDPDTVPEPSHVFAAEVGDDGSAAIEASTLPVGTFIFANTMPEAQCGGRYLQDCRLQAGYMGEFAVLVGSGSTIPGAPAYDPFADASPSPTPLP